MKQLLRDKRFLALVALRTVFAIALLVLLDTLVKLGTNLPLLGVSALAATTIGSLLAFTNLRFRGLLILCAAVTIGYEALWKVLYLLLSRFDLSRVLSPYTTELHTNLLLGTAIVSALTAWAFWRVRSWVTLELGVSAIGAVLLFAAHRNYRFDTLKIINSLAWSLNIDELATMTVIGIGLAILLAAYFYIATLPERPIPPILGNITFHAERKSIARGAAVLLATALGLSFIGQLLYRQHAVTFASRVSNGVGQDSQEGISPLGFHSALGATNQPSAMVRLNTDYKENPFSPMLYMREQALSEFNGHEMVLANRTFDLDIPGITPFEPFRNETPPASVDRVPVDHEVYLLADHKIAFGIDFPLAITPLKNPKPDRFKAAYKVSSLAPAYKLEGLETHEVGDPSWPKWMKEHYTATHSDPRYSELAHKIVAETFPGTSPLPILQARALTDYLSQKSIYTLSPDHEVAADADQTAPYLFGDMRGYCVHFAHAMVYMLRSLGIPARIGTGYLTDLSQSKDGHILLRMSDRHAWAEVYVKDIGWVPFDIQPKQVESHGDSQVDMKLLEDLMSALEPGEELLPKKEAENEHGFKDESSWWDAIRINPTQAFGLLLTFILLALGMKLYIREGWRLPSSERTKVRRAYRAILAQLSDRGIHRQQGETRAEFAARVKTEIGGDVSGTTQIINKSRFSARTPKLDSLPVLTRAECASVAPRSIGSKIVSFLNPASIIAYLSRRGW